MTKVIAMAGKGGTGKTTIAVNLALALERASDLPVQVVDGDVEAPNAHLFLAPHIEETQDVGIQIPVVDEEKCTYCGVCAEVCQYHAIAVLGEKVLVFPELCHGCGSCTANCPEHAISETPRVMGTLSRGRAGKISFASGELNVGEAMAVPVIRQLKKWIQPEGVVIIDAPPGASCPMVEAVRTADFLLLVTEPTPFGFHDLKSAVEVAREVEIPFGVIINRADIGTEEVAEFCKKENSDVLVEILIYILM
jgi:MinD superfamily P-loop ATPase